MKKKLLIVLLLMMPFFIDAKSVDCDYDLYLEYQKASMNIDYETSYSVKDKTFTIKFYNVLNNMYLNYASRVFSPALTESTEVSITGIKEGTTVKLSVNTSADHTNCSTSLRNIQITLPYYNKFYGSEKCEPYKNKLAICKSTFLDYEPTEDLLDDIINNYNNTIEPEPEPDVNPDRTFLDDILDFTIEWGIQILLVAVSSALTVLIFNAKLRKIKHGI